MADKVKFQCGKCGQSLNAGVSKVGQKLPCPACGAVVRVPKPSSLNGEQTLFRAHPAMFRNRPFLFVLLCVMLVGGLFQQETWFLTIIAALTFAIWYLRCLLTTFTVSDKRTTLRKGILSKSTNEVWHSDVRNVQMYQSLTQRIFGVGQIAISSSGQSGMELVVNGIGRPQKAKQIIDDNR